MIRKQIHDFLVGFLVGYVKPFHFSIMSCEGRGCMSVEISNMYIFLLINGCTKNEKDNK